MTAEDSDPTDRLANPPPEPEPNPDRSEAESPDFAGPISSVPTEANSPPVPADTDQSGSPPAGEPQSAFPYFGRFRQIRPIDGGGMGRVFEV